MYAVIIKSDQQPKVLACQAVLALMANWAVTLDNIEGTVMILILYFD